MPWRDPSQGPRRKTPLRLDNTVIDWVNRLANPSKHQPEFPTNQPWFRVGKNLQFIDESASTICGTGQVLEFDDDTGEPAADIFDSSPSLHLGETAIRVHDQNLSQQLSLENQSDSARHLGLSQASIRFETLVEAATGCRAECPRNVPRNSKTEAVTDATLTNSTTGISPAFEFTLNDGDSSEQPFPHSKHLLNPNNDLTPPDFRTFETPQDLSANRVTTISPEAAFSLPITPSLSAHEARLMQHFIEHLAPSIDVVCSSQIFGRLVPRMAFLSPILLTSIFAVASKHISKTIGTTDPTPETYFQETLDHLIPILNEPGALVEDYILAAVVILRVMEEMDSKSRSVH